MCVQGENPTPVESGRNGEATLPLPPLPKRMFREPSGDTPRKIPEQWAAPVRGGCENAVEEGKEAVGESGMYEYKF